MTETSLPAALHRLAASDPERTALVDRSGPLTRADLMTQAVRLARCYASLGVRHGDLVTLALPSDRSMVTAAVAAWLLGAVPSPVPATLPGSELRAIVDVSRPSLVVGVDLEPEVPSLRELPSLTVGEDAPLPDAVSPAWKAPVSGGSTGRPKVILSGTAAVLEQVTSVAPLLRLGPDDVALMTAPLHHNAPFQFTLTALLVGAPVVIAGRFDPAETLRLVEEHAVTWMYAVPTMMSRISKLPDRAGRPVSTLRTVFHMAAPCPRWVKHDWISWLGPDAVWELYAGTEAQAVTVISGSEWLAHEGSVGRVLAGEAQVLTEDGTVAGPGQVGEVWMRSAAPTYRYLGAEARTNDEGWESLGDLGWFDADGYLYLADRTTDMVLVGGANVYPAEVEAALDEHPLVLSSAVIGLPDDDLGNRLHALVHLSAEVPDDELSAWCGQRLSRYKVPRAFERVDAPLRDDAAKVRRSQLRAERVAALGRS